jgi:hypothetical protein
LLGSGSDWRRLAIGAQDAILPHNCSAGREQEYTEIHLTL